ncbi:uncharacterized protein LOC142196211 [Leptodactylus fuscus]|uniref:uncharacterized protein LOC142196211 n=1 Tax=Leptodactylus fuscus TaxID=238119 RepID=UPI003F4F215A
MKRWTLLVLCFLKGLTISGAWKSLQGPREVDNKFVRHHLIMVEGFNKALKNCWICTHSPISSSSLPFIAVPVPMEELINWSGCMDHTHNMKESVWKLWANVTVGIPIVGWTDYPWWQGNLTGDNENIQYVTYNGDRWVTQKKSTVNRLGEIPQARLQISFADDGKKRGDFWTPWVIERTLHNMSWEHAHLFIEGNNHTCKEIPGNIECVNETIEERLYRKKNLNFVCGNRDFGYCGALGKQPSWCMLKNVSSFVDLVHKLITQHSAFFALPPQMYWACGNNAYKWLPVGVKGTCTIVRLTPATFIVDRLNAKAIPKHTLYKRAADNTPRKSGRPHLVQMSTGNKIVSTVLVYPMITQTWDKLVEATDYLDDQIWGILGVLNTTIAVQNQLIIVTNQHTLVLDYVTAAQGGMCQVVGPTCCHYIDPEGNIKGKQELENIYKLREEYEKEVGKNEDSWWSDTFSFLNPVNWFKGIGGWITGILQIIVQIAMVILFIYCFFKLILICFNRCYDKDRYKW